MGSDVATHNLLIQPLFQDEFWSKIKGGIEDFQGAEGNPNRKLLNYKQTLNIVDEILNVNYTPFIKQQDCQAAAKHKG